MLFEVSLENYVDANGNRDPWGWQRAPVSDLEVLCALWVERNGLKVSIG